MAPELMINRERFNTITLESYLLFDIRDKFANGLSNIGVGVSDAGNSSCRETWGSKPFSSRIHNFTPALFYRDNLSLTILSEFWYSINGVGR